MTNSKAHQIVNALIAGTATREDACKAIDHLFERGQLTTHFARYLEGLLPD